MWQETGKIFMDALDAFTMNFYNYEGKERPDIPFHDNSMSEMIQSDVDWMVASLRSLEPSDDFLKNDEAVRVPRGEAWVDSDPSAGYKKWGLRLVLITSGAALAVGSFVIKTLFFSH